MSTTDVDTARESAEQPPTGTPSRRAVRNTVEWILIIAAALGVAFIVKTFFVQAFYIPSGSMEPGLQIGDRVLVNKVSYRLHEINRGDVIVFERPECDASDPAIKDLIKRVIALGGETVESRGGQLAIDGHALSEPYLPDGEVTDDFGPVRVPNDHVWVMGDNRSSSKDSRILCNGEPTFIAEDEVIGRAFVRVWPLNQFKRI